MMIHLSSWPEIDARLKTTKTVVVPIGSNEQHGPTGLLGTDWMCPEIIAHAKLLKNIPSGKHGGLALPKLIVFVRGG